MARKAITEHKALTDRTLKALKPKLAEVWDTTFPAFGVRVSETGRKTFVLAARYPGNNSSARRAIGTYGALTLADAREKARDWLKLIEAGKDPKLESERQRTLEQRRQENTFSAVAEDFIKDKLAGERKGAEVERDVRRVFIPEWGKRPITDITPLDVRNLVKGYKDAGKPYQAHNLLGYARRLFNWAIGQHVYGIEASPCDRLKPKDIIGERKQRIRILSDAELRAAWGAAAELGYPYGPLLRLLILTGQRKSEVAEAQCSEFDLAKKLWTIPADRMKADSAHVVPLSDDAIAILKALPRFESGDYLFSTTFGKIPVNGFSKAKVLFDKKILATLRMRTVRPRCPISSFTIYGGLFVPGFRQSRIFPTWCASLSSATQSRDCTRSTTSTHTWTKNASRLMRGLRGCARLLNLADQRRRVRAAP